MDNSYELNVFGVKHNGLALRRAFLFFGAKKLRASRDLTEVKKRLTNLARQGVTNIGFETLIELGEELNTRGSHIYVKEIQEHANKLKINLVDLTGSPETDALDRFHGIILDSLPSFTREQIEKEVTVDKYAVLEKIEEYAGRAKWSSYNARAKFLRLVDSAFRLWPTFTYDNVNSLHFMISKLRSEKMEEYARQKKLKHIIVGGAHAFDLSLKPGNKVMYLGDSLKDKYFEGYKEISKLLVVS